MPHHLGKTWKTSYVEKVNVDETWINVGLFNWKSFPTLSLLHYVHRLPVQEQNKEQDNYNGSNKIPMVLCARASNIYTWVSKYI